MSENKKLHLEEEAITEAPVSPEFMDMVNNQGISLHQRQHDGSMPDFNASNDTPISKEEALKLYKEDPTKLLLMIEDSTGRLRGVRFNSKGKVIKDKDSRWGSWRFDLPKENAYVSPGKSGAVITDVFYIPAKYLINIAKECKRYDEVNRDYDKIMARRQNPESKYTINDTAKTIQRKYRNTENEINDFDRFYNALDRFDYPENISIWRINRIKDSILDGIKVNKDPNTGEVFVEEPQYYFRREGQQNANDWLKSFKYALRQWGWDDSDTISAWLAYQVAKHDGDKDAVSDNPIDGLTGEFLRSIYKNDRPKDSYKKEMSAELRYVDVKDILQAPKDAFKDAVGSLRDVQRQLDWAKNNRDNYISPKQRATRIARLQDNIASARARLMRYLEELEEYENNLDKFEEEDAAKVKELTDNVERIASELAELKQKTNPKKGEVFPQEFRNKVPESLKQEGDTTIVENKQLTKKLILSESDDLNEDLIVPYSQEDSAASVRNFIKACWEDVDKYSMMSGMFNDFGSQAALRIANQLVNELYVAIGQLEGILNDVDPKSEAIDSTETVQVMAQVDPQLVTAIAQPQVPVLHEKLEQDKEVEESCEKDESLTEEVIEKGDAQKELEKPVKKELDHVEKDRKENVKELLNPDEEVDEVFKEDLDTSNDDPGMTVESLLEAIDNPIQEDFDFPEEEEFETVDNSAEIDQDLPEDDFNGLLGALSK